MNAPAIVILERTPRGTARRLSIRNVIVPAALLGLALLLTLAALRSEQRDSLPATLAVTSLEDPYGVGATTRATVELRNEGGTEMRPRFSVTWLPYPYYWTILSGPPILEAGATATYVIQSPASTSAPNDGQAFNIRVNDGRSITYSISEQLREDKRSIAVRNPTFGLWSQSDPTTGLDAPAGWNVYRRRGIGDAAALSQADAFGVSAVHLAVGQDGQTDDGAWSHTGLTQEIPFPEGPLAITVLSFAPYRAQPGGWPLTGFGIEVSDPKNGLLWILFQPTGRGNLSYDLPSGHHIEVIDVPLGQWATERIDLEALYQGLRWAPAETVTLKVFAAASSTEAGSVEGYVARIDAAE